MPNGARTGRSKRPTIEDVAARAGVSVGTASNVLNHPHKVAPATVAKVADVIAELGFSRNSIASALASGDTRTLGLVVDTLRNSLFVDIARGAQRVAREPALRSIWPAQTPTWICRSIISTCSTVLGSPA